MIWVVTLQGSPEDVERISAELPSTVTPVAGDPERLRVEIVDGEPERGGDAMRRTIETTIERINGLGRLRWGRSFQRLATAGIAKVNEDGSSAQVLFIDPVYAHFLPEERAQILRNWGQPVPPMPAGWAEIQRLNLEAVAHLAETSSDVEQVLHLVDRALEHDAQLDWVLAYLALELIEADLDEHDLSGSAVGLWSAATHRRFKRTANSFGTLGLRARHGKEGSDPPTSPMTDSDAGWFLRRSVTRWVNGRLGLPLD